MHAVGMLNGTRRAIMDSESAGGGLDTSVELPPLSFEDPVELTAGKKDLLVRNDTPNE